MDTGAILWWVLLLGGLAVWWIVHSARRRRALQAQVNQLTARVYGLEQELKAQSKLISGLMEHPVAPTVQPAASEERSQTPLERAIEWLPKPAPRQSLPEVFPEPTSARDKGVSLPEVTAPQPGLSSAELQAPAAEVRPRSPEPLLTFSTEVHKPAPHLFSAVERTKSILNLEETLGANWLNKLGIVIFVIGVALFLAYELRALGPAGKIVVGYLTGLGLLGAGGIFEKRERYRILARAGIGGGWALVFFTAYAMYHVPASRVLSSQGADLVLMLAVAVLMVLHTLRYRSQVATGLAFLLAFSTVTISHVSVYSLSASAILAIALVVIVLRMGWFELEILGILATYINHYVWLRPVIEPMQGHPHPFPQFAASAALLILYWAVFRASYLVRRVGSPHQESISTAAALLNAFLLLGLMKYQAVHPEWAFWFLLGLGAAELGLGQLRTIRQRRTPFVILTTLGVALLMTAFPFRCSGEHLSVLWLLEAEAFFMAGVLTAERLFRRLGLLATLVVIGQMLAVDTVRAVHGPRLGSVFALAAAILYANAHWIPRRWPGEEPNDFFWVLERCISYLAALNAAIALWIVWPGAWTAVAWAALALALAYAGRRLKIEALALQANLVASLSIVRALATNTRATETYHHLTLRLITISIVAALLYLFSRWSLVPSWMKAGRLPGLYTWAASVLIGLVAWYELRPASVALGWALLALALLEAGLKWRSMPLRLQAYALFGASFLRVLFVNLNAAGSPGEISPRVVTIVPLALAYYYVYERLAGRGDEFLQRDLRSKAAQVHCFFGTIAVAALMRFELDLDWVAAAWAALVLILMVLAWRTGRRIFLHQACFMGFAVLFRTVLHNLYERSYFPAPLWDTRWVVVGTVVVILTLVLVFAFQLEPPEFSYDTGDRRWARALAALERYPEQFFFFIPFVLLTFLLAVELRHGLVTLGWGVEAVAVFLLALKVGRRSYRLSALGLLLLCVLKIAFVDVWGLAPRDRYVTFIALGSALLLVSFLYSKYRDVLSEYL